MGGQRPTHAQLQLLWVYKGAHEFNPNNNWTDDEKRDWYDECRKFMGMGQYDRKKRLGKHPVAQYLKNNQTNPYAKQWVPSSSEIAIGEKIQQATNRLIVTSENDDAKLIIPWYNRYENQWWVSADKST